LLGFINEVKEIKMNVKELLGREVLDSNAEIIGKVSDIEFDINQGVISNVVVKAGMIRKYDVKFDNIAKIGDKIVLRVSEEELKRKSVVMM
jgi:sporulation protein YlmC with PRC-barrel domain